MKTLRKLDLESMREELQVLQREDERSILGGAKITTYTDPNDVPQHLWDEASGYVDDSGNYYPEGIGSGSSGNDDDRNETTQNDSWTKSFDNEKDLKKFLSSWVKNADYVEVEIYFYKDGTYDVVRDKENTLTRCYSNLKKGEGENKGKYYNDGKEVVGFGHTHHNTPEPSYPSDTNYAAANKGIDHYIFYGNSLYPYW